MRGKLAIVINQIEHGHHVFRAYFKHAFLRVLAQAGLDRANIASLAD
jgi:hypothetical protein